MRKERIPDNSLAKIAAVAGGLFGGTLCLFVGGLSAEGFSTLQISFVRLLVATVVYFVATLLVDRKQLVIRVRDLWIFACAGLAGLALFYCCYAYAIVHTSPSVAAVLLYSAPAFTLLLSALVFKEKVSRYKLAAIVFAFAGCVCVTGLPAGKASLSPGAFAIGLGAGLFYALYTIINRFALKKYSPLTVTFYTFLMGALGLLPVCHVDRIGVTLANMPDLWLLCLGIGLVSTAVPYLLYTFSLKRLEAGRASILAAVEPVMAAVLGVAVLGEMFSAFKLLGIVFVLTAVVLVNINSKG